MKISKRHYKYALDNYNEVHHTTINPEGPGVVRVHLIPPEFTRDDIDMSVVILNGQDIVPLGPSWTVLLCELIKEVNKYEGREIEGEDYDSIIKNTLINVRKVFPFVPKRYLRKDIKRILNTFKQIAYGEIPDENIGTVSLGDYADKMSAPHRMDLMVSAMTIDGNWHCNQRCVHCYAAGQNLSDETELGTEDWKKIIDKCRSSKIPQVTFTGGEPTMRDDLIELIDHSKWFVTRLNTNGVRLTPEYCRDLFAASLDSVQITLYSADKTVHNKLVGADRYDSTVAGIENALAAGLNVSINTPLCKANTDYIDTLQFLHDKGIIYVTCSGLITTGNAAEAESEELQLSYDEIKKLLTEAVSFCNANGMQISFTSPGWIEKEYFEELGINTPTCGACLSNMAVTPGGNVVPCQSWLTGKPLGSMLNDSFKDIWNSAPCTERRNYSAFMLGLCPLRTGRGTNAKEVCHETL